MFHRPCLYLTLFICNAFLLLCAASLFRVCFFRGGRKGNHQPFLDHFTDQFGASMVQLTGLFDFSRPWLGSHRRNDSAPPSDLREWELVERESNLAATYWVQWTKLNSQEALSRLRPGVTYCEAVNLTDPLAIEQSTLHYQRFAVPGENLTIYLYNAYYDDRKGGQPVVRLLTVNKEEPQGQLLNWWCLLWFDGIISPALVPLLDYYNMWPPQWAIPGAKYYQAQLLSCPIPAGHLGDIPRAVSLQARGECTQVEAKPSNVLRVQYNAPKRESEQTPPSIGVCVHALALGTYDTSTRIVEWLEMVKLMGAEKVYFYKLAAPESVMKVLRHYQKEGFVDWRPFTLVDDQPNVPSLYLLWTGDQNGNFYWPAEMLELNDCLYRNLNRHEYLVIMDLDEMIVPLNLPDWHQLLPQFTSNPNVTFLAHLQALVNEVKEETVLVDSQLNRSLPVPGYLYMLRHTSRLPPLACCYNVKSFLKTESIVAVHNHMPFRCIDSPPVNGTASINGTGYHTCNGAQVGPETALLLHFRRDRRNETSNGTLLEHTLWRFFDKLQPAVTRQLTAIFN